MLNGFKTSNFGTSTLLSSITDTSTQIQIPTEHITKFATLSSGQWFMITIGGKEIVKCVGISGNTLTVIRGQENTTARSWPSGTRVSATITAGTFGEIANQLDHSPSTVTTKNLTFPEPDDGKGVGWSGSSLANIEFATQTYVQSEVVGLPSIEEAPNNGVAYLRRNKAWESSDSRYPLISGSATLFPAGASSARPSSPPVGAFRFNTDINNVEWWTGSSWESPPLYAPTAIPNTVVWADDAGDLDGGSGFTWPSLYYLSGSNQFSILDKINFGSPFRTLPAPPNSSDPAEYTISNDDLGCLLVCQEGTTNLTLPAMSLPNSTDENGLTGIEYHIMVDIPSSSTLKVIRGTGAELWAGFGSGDVPSYIAMTESNERKRVKLVVRHPGLWQVLVGEDFMLSSSVPGYGIFGEAVYGEG